MVKFRYLRHVKTSVQGPAHEQPKDHDCSTDLVSDAQRTSLSSVNATHGDRRGSHKPVRGPWRRGLRQELPQSARPGKGGRGQGREHEVAQHCW